VFFHDENIAYVAVFGILSLNEAEQLFKKFIQVRRMSESVLSTCCCLILFIASILFIVMSGVGYAYFSSPWFFVNATVNLKVLFGCGIGIGILVFLGLWLYLLITSECALCHVLTTIPAFILMCSLYLAFTTGKAPNNMLDAIDEAWATEDAVDKVASIQWQFECCGWANATDRALVVCPDNFESGCKQVAEEYMKPRYNDVMVSTIVEFSFFLVPIVFLWVCACIRHEDAVAEQIFGLSDLR
jgi:hypothetical protein